jgi:5-methylcytosine-specific restriction endonuclease McrA
MCCSSDRRLPPFRGAQGTGRQAWQRLRRQVLERDGYRCLRCGAPATSVHLDPRLKGRHDLATADRCASLCAVCHGAVDGPRAARSPR